MLNEIMLFVEQHLAFALPDNTEEQLRLASIALLMEMVIVDDKNDPKEQEAVLSLVKKHFSLNEKDAQTLIEAAEQKRKQATDYFEFTSLINDKCSSEQKIQLIESLWKIAFIDGLLDPQEEYLVRKIAHLLHVSHEDFIMTKNRVTALKGESLT